MTIARAVFFFLFAISTFTLVGAGLLSTGSGGEHHPVDGYGVSAGLR